MSQVECRCRKALCIVVATLVLLGVLAVVRHPMDDPTWEPSMDDGEGSMAPDVHRGSGNLTNFRQAHFSKKTGTDVNVGITYDLKQLSRHSCPRQTNLVKEATASCSEEEPLETFVERCAKACLEAGAGDECTAFVILYDGECVLKRFIVSHRLEREDAVSYVRRMHPTDAVFKKNYRLVEPHLLRKKLGFAVLATSKHVRGRLVPALQTWLCDVDAVFLFEDDAESRAAVASLLGHGGGFPSKVSFWGRGGNVGPLQPTAAPTSTKHNTTLSNLIDGKCLSGKHFVFEAAPDDPTLRSYNGAWKNFPLVEHIHHLMPLKTWYLMVDDDSFVIQHNLNLVIHSTFERVVSPLARAMMFGAIFRVGGTKELFVQGGAGILLTRAAVQFLRRAVAPASAATLGPSNHSQVHQKPHILREGVPQCYEWCQQWAGDVRLGCCARMLGIAMKHDFTFWSEDVAVSVASRRQVSYFPTTLHQMKDGAVVRDTHAAVGWWSANVSSSWSPSSTKVMDVSRAQLLAHTDPPAMMFHPNASLVFTIEEALPQLPLYWEPIIWFFLKIRQVSWLDRGVHVANDLETLLSLM